LYPDRPAEIGIPAENPRLKGPGVVLTGFVNRVGDPRGVVAPDGSVHRGEVLLADGLRALAYAATGGRPLPDDVAVTYPA
ncbi:Hsp70 family protein, partial [Mycobacterium kansasii]